MGKDDEIAVSDTDEMTVAGGPYADRARKLGEYRPTNAPLSAEEIRRRRESAEQAEEWQPRDSGNVEEVNPLADDEPEKEEDWPDGA